MDYFNKEVALIVKHAECVFGVKYVSSFSATVFNSYSEEYAKTGGVPVDGTLMDTVKALEDAMGIEIERKTFRFTPHYFDNTDTAIICITWRLKGK